MYMRFRMFAMFDRMNKIVEEDPSQQLGALWLGDMQAAMDKTGLKDNNIRTVITTASGLGIVNTSNHIVHHVYNILDLEDFNISKFFDRVIRDIQEGLKRGSVLVHCAAGVSRSASCVIAYLMKTRSWTFQQAMGFVKQKRRVIFPNYGFQQQLRVFQRELQAQQYTPQDKNLIGSATSYGGNGGFSQTNPLKDLNHAPTLSMNKHLSSPQNTGPGQKPSPNSGLNSISAANTSQNKYNYLYYKQLTPAKLLTMQHLHKDAPGNGSGPNNAAEDKANQAQEERQEKQFFAPNQKTSPQRKLVMHIQPDKDSNSNGFLRQSNIEFRTQKSPANNGANQQPPNKMNEAIQFAKSQQQPYRSNKGIFGAGKNGYHGSKSNNQNFQGLPPMKQINSKGSPSNEALSQAPHTNGPNIVTYKPNSNQRSQTKDQQRKFNQCNEYYASPQQPTTIYGTAFHLSKL